MKKQNRQHPDDRQSQFKRLARIRGQIDGIGRMIEEDRHRVDILIQLRAVHAALRKVEEQVLREHAEQCVARTLKSPDGAQSILDELFDTLGRFGGR
ncbi:MAG TPA: metal-sensitive transcriptional regulator [Gammaproteobacteria bacterium]